MRVQVRTRKATTSASRYGSAQEPGSSKLFSRLILGRLPSDLSAITGCAARFSLALYSPLTELLTTVMIFVSFFLIIQDTDARANGGQAPEWNARMADGCFVYFVFEFLARLFVEKTDIVREYWNCIDFLVVAVGMVEVCMRVALEGKEAGKSMHFVRIFRVVRILRLLRVLRIMKTFQELWKMVKMLATCGKTLVWAFVLAFLITTVWSVVLVEFVSPLVRLMEKEQQVWKGQTDWINAYSSVMRSNLSLFQTIVAGDSWGTIPVPVINEYPWTALIFVPAHIVLFFGVMNLIIAVVVETFADIRERNRKTMSEEKEEQERAESAALIRLFEKIDSDRDGIITLSELEIAAASIPQLQQRLQIFGIKGDDLEQLFAILDENNSGGVDLDEFVEVFCRMKCGDTRATTTLVKAYVMDLVRRQRQASKDISQIQLLLGGRAAASGEEPRAQAASFRGSGQRSSSAPPLEARLSEASPPLSDGACNRAQRSYSWGSAAPVHPAHHAQFPSFSPGRPSAWRHSESPVVTPCAPRKAEPPRPPSTDSRGLEDADPVPFEWTPRSRGPPRTALAPTASLIAGAQSSAMIRCVSRASADSGVMEHESVSESSEDSRRDNVHV